MRTQVIKIISLILINQFEIFILQFMKIKSVQEINFIEIIKRKNHEN